MRGGEGDEEEEEADEAVMADGDVWTGVAAAAAAAAAGDEDGDADSEDTCVTLALSAACICVCRRRAMNDVVVVVDDDGRRVLCNAAMITRAEGEEKKRSRCEESKTAASDRIRTNGSCNQCGSCARVSQRPEGSDRRRSSGSHIGSHTRSAANEVRVPCSSTCVCVRDRVSLSLSLIAGCERRARVVADC